MKKQLIIFGLLISSAYGIFRLSDRSYEKEACYVREDDQSYADAKQATDAMWRLHNALGLNKEELLDIARYIEIKSRTMSFWDEYYMRKEKTHLARTIEYDRKTKRFFIHLKKHNIPSLGTGQYKSVTRSILYDRDSPELVANCVFLDKKQKEIRITKKLSGNKGLANTYAVMRHKKKNGSKVVSIIQKLYNFGSFLRAPRKLKRLSTRKKVMICRDILQGIETMHAFDLVHRDLHGKNILLHKEIDPKSGKKTISANLIDFGKTTSAKAAASYAPKVQVPRKYNPPEVFLYSPLEIDAKKVDLYAVGLNLYFFYFKKFPEWVVKEDFLQISQMNDEQKKAFGNLLITKITNTIQNRLNTTKFKECQELKEVILSLCQALPQDRLTAGAAREKLDLFLANNHQELASL